MAKVCCKGYKACKERLPWLAAPKARQAGFTLLELMVTVAIVGLLAAVAIPVFSEHVREARLGEAPANLQGILESEQAFFLQYNQYSPALTPCPVDLPAEAGSNQLWPETPCSDDWARLGWRADGAVYLQYQVFSGYDATGQLNQQPEAILPDSNAWGVDWTVGAYSSQGVALENLLPWCTIQAMGDTDLDGVPVFFRTNNYNQKIYRTPQEGVY